MLKKTNYFKLLTEKAVADNNQPCCPKSFLVSAGSPVRDPAPLFMSQTDFLYLLMAVRTNTKFLIAPCLSLSPGQLDADV